MTYRIFTDQDSVIYNLSEIWYGLHNIDYPNHNLRVEDVNGWDTAEVCKRVGCIADIYSYFDNPKVWTDGTVICGADYYTKKWYNENIADLGILTTAANGMSMPHKMKWLKDNFPYIKDIIMVNGHIKHLIRGDILIDDAIHNLEKWEGIAILFDQPWNQEHNGLRAKSWYEVDILVRDAIELLDDNYTHKEIEVILKTRYNR